MARTARAALCALIALCFLSRTAPAQAQDTDASMAPAEPARSTILLFDSPLGGLHQIEEVSNAIQAWMSSRLLPGDTVAVASYYGCELQVQQDFTSDRDALTGAIADAVRGRPHAGRAPEEGAVSLAARLPQGEELSQRTANFYGLLQVLAHAAEGVPGRKSLLVFSKGFGRSHLFEDETGPSMELIEHADLTDSGLPGNPIQEKYLADRRLYEPTLEALQEAQVTLYPVDLATDYRETYPLAGVMCQLAAGTGGRYFYPALDVASLLDRVAEDRKNDPAVPPAERTELAGGTGGSGRAAETAQAAPAKE
jgi:VWFA-related protein